MFSKKKREQKKSKLMRINIWAQKKATRPKKVKEKKLRTDKRKEEKNNKKWKPSHQ